MKIDVKSRISPAANDGEDLELIITATIPHRISDPSMDFLVDDENACLHEDLMGGIDPSIDEFLTSITSEGTIEELLAGSGANELVCDGQVVCSEESAHGFQFRANKEGDPVGVQRSFREIVKKAVQEPSWWTLSRKSDERELTWKFHYEYFVMGTPTQP